MSGRRNQTRVTFVNSSGVLRVSRDVIVEKSKHNEFVAVSSEPGVPGDLLTIAFCGNNDREIVTVRVTASRPRLVNGGVKHELQLKRVDCHADHGADERGAAGSGSE
jgi:hypothetical protein